MTFWYHRVQGTVIFASGSPFPPVQHNNKTYHPGQGNNAYIFPGVALGVLCSGSITIPEEMFLIASKSLSDMVTENDLANGSLYPPLHMIPQASTTIAVQVMNYAYEKGKWIFFIKFCQNDT